MRRLVTMTTLVLCLLVLLHAGCTSGSPHPGISPKANAALQSMSDTLGSAKAMSFHAIVSMDETLESGQNVQLEREVTLTMIRPDKLHAEVLTDELTESVWYDGKKVTLHNVTTNKFASVDASGTVGVMLDRMIDEYDMTMPLADMLVADIYGSLTSNIKSGRYVGLHTVNGSDCHHLAFAQKNIDWQIWIDAGETAVPRKLLITYKLEPNHPQYTAVIDKWNLTDQLPAESFTFSVPDDAMKIELSEFLGERGQ